MTSDELAVMEVIEKIGDPLMNHIEQRTGFDNDRAWRAVRSLMDKGYVRSKEDEIDHAWAYRLTQAGRTVLQQTHDEAF